MLLLLNEAQVRGFSLALTVGHMIADTQTEGSAYVDNCHQS